MSRKLILFELNEVPYVVLDEYCRRYPTSFLAQAVRRCDQYTTVAADRVQLDPWVSWPTLHRGVADTDHGILHLGQDLTKVDEAFPPIWRLLADQGFTTGVFGSLHSSNVPANVDSYAFFLPDFFAHAGSVHPAQLRAFHEFNLVMTRLSARNVRRDVPWKPALAFAASVPRIGIRPSTIFALARQVLTELRDPARKTRRRSIQPVLMFDVFEKLLRTKRPEFVTFYTNHVAAAMHRYWAAFFPDDADAGLSDDWKHQYSDEIPFAMHVLSEMLERLFRFADQDQEYKVVVATSMGQGAIEHQETHEFLTITDLPRFMGQLGIPNDVWESRNAMVPHVSVVVNEAARSRFRERLSSLSIDGHRMVADPRPVAPLSFDERDGGFFHIYTQFDSYTGSKRATLGDQNEISVEQLGLGMMAHEDGVNCTAQHTPEGVLLVYDPARPTGDRARNRVSTLDVLPSILAGLGASRPSYLKGERSIAI